MNNLTHCPHCGKSLYEPKKPDLSTWSLEAQIMAGVPNIYIPRSDKIKNALREHFKITPFWSSKFERQWMEWAVSVDMTEKQILYASWTFQADDRYNWQAANLKSICDHWEDLKILQWGYPVGTWEFLGGGTGSTEWEKISNGEWTRVSDGMRVGGDE